jgi:hypothetical protein
MASSTPAFRHHNADSDTRRQESSSEADVERAILEARKKGGKLSELPLTARLQTVDAKGESLAEYLTSQQPVVNNDLAKAHGQWVTELVRRGAKSSVHVPAKLNGQNVTINFWSRDPNAFPPQAVALLTAVAQIMAAPKDQPQAAAR